MSVNLQAIRHPTPATHVHADRARARDAGRSDFSALLEQGVATASSNDRRPGAPGTPRIPTPSEGGAGAVDGSSSGASPATEGNEVSSRGKLSDDPRTAGMYVPPDFYHGTSYSPVFDHQDESGNWVATPRFEGQVVYGPWRGSLPPDYDPNARVQHDPLNVDQGPNYWRQDEAGNWVKRDTGYGGIPLNDDGQPIFTPDPSKYPEYFVAAPANEDDA
jgi:hypothetical protein